MKALQKITLTAVGGIAFYFVAKLAWVLFWDILYKIFAVLQTAVMVAIVMAAVYVLWKILSYKSTGERD